MIVLTARKRVGFSFEELKFLATRFLVIEAISRARNLPDECESKILSKIHREGTTRCAYFRVKQCPFHFSF